MSTTEPSHWDHAIVDPGAILSIFAAGHSVAMIAHG